MAPNTRALILGWVRGLSAAVRMTLGPPRAVLEIPEEAILSEQGKKYVVVVGKDDRAEWREVTLGPADHGRRIIEKGLAEEDWLVIAGLGGLRPGEPVEPRKKAGSEGSRPGRK